MKTIKQVKREHAEHKALISAVLKNINKENIEDVNAHGIMGGFGNFIYYHDTVRFARRHISAIRQLLREDSEDLGIGLLEMVASFNCLHGDFSVDEIGRVLYGREKDCGDDAWIMVNNALAWYAAETVCRWFED